MNQFALVTNSLLFAGTTVAGIEVSKLETPIAISVGFLVVALKFSFELGKMVRKLDDICDKMEILQKDSLDLVRWRGEVEAKLNNLPCQKSDNGKSEKCATKTH